MEAWIFYSIGMWAVFTIILLLEIIHHRHTTPLRVGVTILAPLFPVIIFLAIIADAINSHRDSLSKFCRLKIGEW